MPQITLKYSANITDVEFDPIFQKIHNVLSEITDIKTCKSRAQKLKTFRIGEGENKNAIVHLEIALLPGRSEEIKEKMGLKIIEILNESFLPIFERLGLDCNPTIEIKTLQNYFISNMNLFKLSKGITPGIKNLEATPLKAKL